MEDAEPVFLGKGVDSAVAAVVSEGRGDRVVDRCVRVVFNRECEKRDRHRRVAVVVRDEWAEGRHSHLARKARLVELELGDRKAADERDIVKVGDSCHRIAIGAKTKSVKFARTRRTGRRSLIGSVQNASAKQFAVLLRLDGEVAVAVELTDRGPVTDAPIDQSAAACQRHAAGPDAAKRKRDVFPPVCRYRRSGRRWSLVFCNIRLDFLFYVFFLVLDAAHGYAFNHQLLRKEEDQDHGQHGHAHGGHDHGEIAGGEIAAEEIHRDRQCH